MKLMLTQFFGSLIGGLLLINSQHVSNFYIEGIMIVGGTVVMSMISNYVGQKQVLINIINQTNGGNDEK